MKSTVETLSPTRVKLAVEVPFAELRPSLDAAYKAIGSQVKVPGFRPGKVPARVIDQRVGRSAVLEEAINKALPKAYSEAVRETGLRALGQPEIEVTNFEDNSSLSFTAEVDVSPTFDLPDYRGVAVVVDDVIVGEEDVEEQVESLRARFGTLTGVDRPVENGDFVSLDLRATVDGEEVEGGSASGMSYQVGSGDLLEGIDDAIVGLDAGAEATFLSKITYGDHAGSDAEITAAVKSVKVRELPEVDDEFAQLASEFDTVEELRSDIRTRLSRVKALEQGAEARDKILQALLDAAEVPVPESSVLAEIEWREHDVIHALDHDDAALEQYLETEGKSKEEWQAGLRETAERSVRSQLILDSIADAESLSVSDAELTSYIVNQARRYGMPPQEFADQVVKGGNIAALVADVRRNKALATIMESADVSDASGNPVDLSALATVGGELDFDALAADAIGDDAFDDDALDDDALVADAAGDDDGATGDDYDYAEDDEADEGDGEGAPGDAGEGSPRDSSLPGAEATAPGAEPSAPKAESSL